MEVKKDRVKKFIDMTKEDAVQSASYNLSSRYSFDTFCKEHNLYKEGKEERSGGYVITCPFHEDAAPSFNFNDKLGVFNCFSCGGGTYWKFVYRYRTEVLGEHITWYQMINEALQSDPDVMAKLGFNTIFGKSSATDVSDILTSKYKFRKKVYIPNNYLELQRDLLKLKPSYTQIKLFILMMQSNVDVELAYKQLILGEGFETKKKYDISKMEEF